jgi:hypothetical protein
MMDQVRYFKLEGDRLIVETAPAMNPNWENRARHPRVAKRGIACFRSPAAH